MSTCATPPSTSGGTVITSGPYYNGSSAVYQCQSGYYMTGDSFIVCDGTNWVGTTPSCSVQDTNKVYVTLDQNTESIQAWLGYVIATLCILLGLLVLVCMLAVCCHFCGCYRRNMLFGEPTYTCLCCRRSSTTHSYDVHKNSCKTFPRRFFYDQKGRRFHIDDMGRRCYKDHQNTHVAPSESDETSTRSTFVTVSEVGLDKGSKPAAKELLAWKPHAQPVRNINTSTK